MRISLRPCLFGLIGVLLLPIFPSCPNRQGRLPPPPAFLQGSAARGTDYGCPILFPLPSSVAPRSFSRVQDGYLAWDGAEKLLIAYSSQGAKTASWPYGAVEAWLGPQALLMRESASDPVKGNRFSVWEATSQSQPRLLWEGWLNCAIAEAPLRQSGKVYVAGQAPGGRTHLVLELAKGKEAHPVLEAGSWNDSLRLIDTGDGIIAFASSSLREKRPFRLFSLKPGRFSAFTEEAVAGIPPQVLCASGTGFSLRDEPILPVALSNGDYGLLRLRQKDGAWMPAAFTPRAGYCERALGTDQAGGMAFYVATDPLSPARGKLLARYNGVDISLETIP